MKAEKYSFNRRQMAFQELFIGTLIYVVVLGFFNEYTKYVYAKGFMAIFLGSVVLEILTFLVFRLEHQIIGFFKSRTGNLYRILMVASVWGVMIISKFIFVLALDLIFGDYIKVKGFFGILAVVLSVTVIQKLAYKIFARLGSD
jgi:FlaA1/EpsC-like NDP-sugar epimerase